MPRGRNRDEEGTPLEEALEISRREGAALQESDADDEDFNDEEEDDFLPDAPPYAGREDFEDEDEDLLDMNNPDVETFGEAPLIGARTGSSDMFGSAAQTIGRATSPKLYAQASQWPSAVQYRVWRWENGIPVAIGAIDAEATEDDFVQQFYDAMPGKGDGKYQFRFRPVDIRGKELGKEFTLNISEYHSEVQRIRRRKDKEREERGVTDPILINQGADGGAYAEEMGRMFEQAVESAERRTELLQQTLEEERDRLREEEKARYKERIDVANQSTEVVKQMTQQLMETDRARSQEQLKAQEGQSGLLLQTLTTVFSQQQEAARTQAERSREVDEARARQDREFYERQRQDVESRRQRERDEAEQKRRAEQEEWERRRQQEREEAERRRLQEKEEAQSRIEMERDRLALEQKRIEEQRKFELEQMRLEADRREREAERRRETEKLELEHRLERERQDLQRQQEAAREERERWRVELEEKRRAEREEWERKQQQVREDAERRERQERERLERERQDFQLRMERERQEREDAAARRADEARREEERRREQAKRDEEARKADMEMRVKQMELEAERARQHQERLAEQARLDREAQREAAERRAAAEREAREAADRERERNHAFMVRQMEIEKEQAREHQERLMARESGGGGSLFGTLGEQLGMEGPEILEKIFGGKDDEGGWVEAIPKVLGSIAELGRAAITAKADQQKQIQQHGRRKVPQIPPGSKIVQTPQGPMLYVPGGQQGLAMTEPGVMPIPPHTAGGIPPHPVPPPPGFSLDDEDFEDEIEGGEGADEDAEVNSSTPAPELEPEPIDTMKRAKEAGMSLMDQKKARKALRSLADKLAETEEDEWIGLITEAVSSEVNIYYYIKAVTVDAAFTEASDDEELKAKVAKAMKESGLVPDDVPYDEADFEHMKGGEK